MASINNEAANTRKMREHQQKKYLNQVGLSTQEETDLIMCSTVVDLQNSVALNQSVDHASLVAVMLANPKDLALVSDVDAQLLIKVLFKDPVSITSAGFRAETKPTNLSKICSGPKDIKCFVNLEDLDFVDTETTNPAQIIELKQEQLNGSRVSLRGTRFSRCTSVQFFIENNQEETDFTFINRLCLWGRLSPLYKVD